MATKFKVGDHVRWNSEARHVSRRGCPMSSYT
jgi:hypothetical protein